MFVHLLCYFGLFPELRLWPRTWCLWPFKRSWHVHRRFGFVFLLSWDVGWSVSAPVHHWEDVWLTADWQSHPENKSCFVYCLWFWGDWYKIYRLIEKPKSLCWILWLFKDILWNNILYSVKYVTFRYSDTRSCGPTIPAKKQGICTHQGPQSYSIFIPPNLLWPHYPPHPTPTPI